MLSIFRMTLHWNYAFTSGTPCGANNPCSDRCFEVNGTAMCFCFSGRMLQDDGVTCTGKNLNLYSFTYVLIFKYLSAVHDMQCYTYKLQ